MKDRLAQGGARKGRTGVRLRDGRHRGGQQQRSACGDEAEWAQAHAGAGSRTAAAKLQPILFTRRGARLPRRRPVNSGTPVNNNG